MSPPYAAVTLWLPTVSADVVHVAVLVAAFTGSPAQPAIVAVPSLKSTVPPGLVAPALVMPTVAVKATGWPLTAAAGAAISARVVPAFSIFSVPPT